MKRLLILALAVFCIVSIASQAHAGGFSLNFGGRNNFRNDAFRAGFRAGQQQQFRQQFNGHNQFRSNQFRSQRFNQFNHGNQFRSGVQFRFGY